MLYLSISASSTSNIGLVIDQRGTSDIAQFQDGGNTVLTIKDGGNVGIGTSSPSSTLDIWGDFTVGTSSTPLLFADVSTGNVGIGTTTPSFNLSIHGGLLADNFYISTTTATSTIAGGLNVGAINQTGSATSTFNNGIDLAGGCFSINGTCIGGSGSGSSLQSFTFDEVETWNALTSLSSSTTIPVWIDTTGLTGGLVKLTVDGVEDNDTIGLNEKVVRVVQATSSLTISTETTGFDLSTLEFVDAFSVISQELIVEGVTFSNDGTYPNNLFI